MSQCPPAARCALEAAANVPSWAVDAAVAAAGDDASSDNIAEMLFLAALAGAPPTPLSPTESPMAFIIDSYGRANSARSAMTAQQEREAADFVASWQHCCVKFARVVLMHPDLFPASKREAGRALLVGRLKRGVLPHGFENDLVAHLGTVDRALVAQLFLPVFSQLRADVLYSTDLDSSWTAFTPLKHLCQFDELRAILVDQPDWLSPPGPGLFVEKRSFLGPFFSPSVFPLNSPQALQQHFAHAQRVLTPAIDANIAALRRQAIVLQEALADLLQLFLRNEIQRPRAIDFLVSAIMSNEKRAQAVMMHQPTWTPMASDGFLHNLLCVLLRLAQPVLRPDKLGIVSGDYFLSPDAPVHFSNDSPLAAVEDSDIEQYLQAHATSTFNFATQAVHFVMATVHVGFAPTFNKLKLQRMTGQTSPNEAAEAWCFYTHLNDPWFLQSMTDFYAFFADWALQQVFPDGVIANAEPRRLPFCAWPEWTVADMVTFFLFSLSYGTKHLDELLQAQATKLIHFIIAMLEHSQLINNPGTRSGLIESIALLTPEIRNPNGTQPNQTSVFFDRLVFDELSISRLTIALMRLYIDINEAEQHTRLNRRYYLSVVLKNLCKHSAHRETLRSRFRDLDHLLTFVMSLIDDTTFLLDEVKSAVDELGRDGAEAERAEARAKTLARLALESMEMLELMTTDIHEPFLRPEIVNRVSAFVNYNLNQLITKPETFERCAQFGFRVPALVQSLCGVFVNLHQNCTAEQVELLADAIVRDERSFDMDVMKRAAEQLSHSFLQDLSNNFRRFLPVVEAALERHLEDEDLGEIPDEYCDSIMSTLMRDPVRLPCGQVADRSVIVEHLLTNKTDPFTRKPMTEDDLVPDDKLREEIEGWIAAQRARIRAEKTAADK
eukprot:m.159335 g.159335  ORF g.159335 m.159335 type:complete len:893 (+) comp10259_c2_seq2:297-2975(+)